MVDEFPADEQVDEQTSESGDTESGSRLSQAARREKLGELSEKIGDHAQQDGDTLVIEAGEPVVLHLELDRDGVYTATWWATALTEKAHHRWREVAEPLLRDGEAIHTSALGGGYLIEIEHNTSSEDEALAWTGDAAPVERVRELLHTFPEAVGELAPEPVPDYLLPPEPELPPLGEAEAGEDEESGDDADQG